MSSHLQNVTVDNMADLQRLKQGVEIRRSKKKRNLQNDIRIKACIARYDAGAYDKLQFLRAISHSLEIHSAGFLAEEVDSDDENDDVNIAVTSICHATPNHNDNSYIFPPLNTTGTTKCRPFSHSTPCAPR